MPKLTTEELRTRASAYDSREFFYGLNFDSVIKKTYPFIERDAAVLVLLTMVDDELHVILTIRSNQVRTHQGEVAFAGGMRERTDRSPVETALREGYEEIGVPPGFVTILACLPPIISRTAILLFPVVGLLNNHKDFTPSCNPSEVSKCFNIPLERFLSNKGHSKREMFVDPLKQAVETHLFEDHLADGDTIVTFGITGFICTLVAAGLYRRKPEYPIWFQFPDTEDEAAWKQVFTTMGLRYSRGFEKTRTKSLTTSKV